MQITRATSPNLLLNRVSDDDKDSHSIVKGSSATVSTFSDYMYGPMDTPGSKGKQSADGKSIGQAVAGATGMSSSTASLLGGYSGFLAQLAAVPKASRS